MKLLWQFLFFYDLFTSNGAHVIFVIIFITAIAIIVIIITIFVVASIIALFMVIIIDVFVVR